MHITELKLNIIYNGANKMNGNIPETVKELYLWINGKIDSIESKIEEIQKSPDNMGKWLVRIIGLILAIGQIFLVMKELKK